MWLHEYYKIQYYPYYYNHHLFISNSGDTILNTENEEVPNIDENEETELQAPIENEPSDDMLVDNIDNGFEMRYEEWPTVFIIEDDIINSVIKSRMNQRLLLNSRERTLLFASIYDMCGTKYNVW